MTSMWHVGCDALILEPTKELAQLLKNLIQVICFASYNGTTYVLDKDVLLPQAF
jgi:hypothetical protein